MGNGGSAPAYFDPNNLETWTVDHVQKLNDTFIAQSFGSAVNEATFKSLLVTVFHEITSKPVEELWLKFDPAQTGTIYVNEVISALCSVAYGPLAQKIELMYSLQEGSHEGISFDECCILFTSVLTGMVKVSTCAACLPDDTEMEMFTVQLQHDSVNPVTDSSVTDSSSENITKQQFVAWAVRHVTAAAALLGKGNAPLSNFSAPITNALVLDSFQLVHPPLCHQPAYVAEQQRLRLIHEEDQRLRLLQQEQQKEQVVQLLQERVTPPGGREVGERAGESGTGGESGCV